jgi:hypothetical protein
MTYWIIVAMMLVAIVAVVLALGTVRHDSSDQTASTAEKEHTLDDDE